MHYFQTKTVKFDFIMLLEKLVKYRSSHITLFNIIMHVLISVCVFEMFLSGTKVLVVAIPKTRHRS